jgi:hypothetical protein
MPAIPRPQSVTITFPPYTTPSGVGTPTIATGSFTLAIPDNSLQFYAMAINFAGIASSLVAVTSALQTVIDPTGGIRVKDNLDPYQYQVVTQALTAAGIPSPGAPPVDVITPNPLGGAMAGTGAIAGAAATAAALGSTAAVENFLSGTIGIGPIVAVGTGFPDYDAPMTVVNSSLGVINTCMTTIATLVTLSVDVPSRALVLKSVMSVFSAALNTQSITAAGRVPPTPPVGI